MNELKKAFVAYMTAVFGNDNGAVILERKKRYFELLHEIENEWAAELLVPVE